MKYFGTDGIRGKMKIDLSDSLLNKAAKAIVLYYKKHKLKNVLLVGNDTRSSSDYIIVKLCATLLKNGIEIHNVGECSSPTLAYLTKKFNYPLGLMLSASHNPAEYNGLKFFNNYGEKTNDEFEKNFEFLMDKKTQLPNNCFSQIKNVENLKEYYISHLKNHKKFKNSYILDCANGGTSVICKSVFPNIEKINFQPNGVNINKNAGCTHLEMLKSLCIKKQKIGFAFDGDGDRVHVVDKDGSIITGDQIIYILSKFYLHCNDVCIGTIYTNTGLEKTLNSRNIKLLRSDVGDKNVCQLMKKENSVLGGEDSGHILLKNFMNTGDGILNAIIIANLLEQSKLSLKQLLADYKEFYQFRENILIENKSFNLHEILNNIELKTKINDFKKLGAKIIIRPSGTEPKLRLFVEHEDKSKAQQILKDLFQIVSILMQ